MTSGSGPDGDFWRTAPLRGLGLVVAAIFFTFAGLGFLLDVRRGGDLSLVQLGLTVVFSGFTAVVFFLVVRHRWRFRLLPIAVLAQIAVARSIDLARELPAGPLSGAALRERLELDSLGAILGSVLGYAFFVAFIQREGARRLRLQAEMALAREIHDSLVPVVSLRTARFEVVGRALPASEVGGDLVDAVAGRDGGVYCCLLDVSGHGVRAGTLMAALKGALRMRLLDPVPPGRLLDELDRVVRQIRRPNMFATAAALHLPAHGEVSASLAGHLPVLHWSARTGEVARASVGGPALGILEGAAFPVAHLAVEAGDLLALLTDGLVEVRDGADREWGLPGAEALIRAHGGEPLEALGERLLAAARAHGPQQDDETYLLVRVLAAAAAEVEKSPRPGGPTPAC